MSNSTSPFCPSKLAALLRSKSFVSLVKYVVVGISQNSIFYAMMLLLLWCGLSAWQATIVLYPVAVFASFLLNRYWSFSGRNMRARQLHRYVTIYLVTYFLTVFLNWIQEREGVPPWLAILVTMVLTAGAVFATLNYWVFRKDVAQQATIKHPEL
jgi:putative flippase GtrA